MKIIRYQNPHGKVSYGAELPAGEIVRLEGDIFSEYHVTGESAQIAKLLAPVAPAAFLCIGLNYKRHAAESKLPLPKFPVLFTKGVNTLQHPNEPILIPTHLRSDEVDYECELAVVIGKACKNVRRTEALDYVLGYTCANDVSARDWQIKYGGSQWCRGKSFDTFAPLGPRLVTRDEMKTDCCYATQDKTWVHDPDGNEWEAFVVLKDNLPEVEDATSCCSNGVCTTATA
jgi:2-keto-4-pentenoate hydratase/2-oxohepta-3-ene-1,7-dioic acid hydratase in catechol pathway